MKIRKKFRKQDKATTSNNKKMKGKNKDSVPMTEQIAQEENNYTKYKVSTYIICALAIIGATAPFWHRFTDEYSTIPYLKFKNFSIFLYQFGVHLSSFTTSLFFLWVIGFIPNSAKSIKRLIASSVLIFIAVSLYFLIWVFMPLWSDEINYPKSYSRIAVAISSITLTFLLFKLTKASFSYIDSLNSIVFSLRNKISFLIKNIFELRAKHFLPTLAKAIKRGNKNDFSNIREEIEKADLYIKESLTKIADD